MKKIIYVLVLPLAIGSGLAFANREIKNETFKKSAAKSRTRSEMTAERNKWEASPNGIKFKKWQESPEGIKVLDNAAKINNQIKNSADIAAVVTSLYLPLGAQLGFGVMVRINREDYILSFGLENSNEFQQLRSLKVNDKITIRGRGVMYAPKYSYPIVAGDYVQRDNKIIYKRIPNQDAC